MLGELLREAIRGGSENHESGAIGHAKEEAINSAA